RLPHPLGDIPAPSPLLLPKGDVNGEVGEHGHEGGAEDRAEQEDRHRGTAFATAWRLILSAAAISASVAFALRAPSIAVLRLFGMSVPRLASQVSCASQKALSR